MVQEVTLLPCPFCGGDKITHGSVHYGAHSFGEVECQTCGVLATADTEAEAITAWNTRTTALEAENAALREALNPFCDFADFEDCPGVMLELNDFRNDNGESFFALARQALGQPT